MKMTINRAKFIEALGNVKKVLPSKTVVPVLGCVELNAVSEDAIELVGTDMATSIKVTCPCKESNGRVLVDCDKLMSVASVMVGEEITISSLENDSRILVTDGKSKYRITISADETLPAAFGKESVFCTVDAQELKDAVSVVLFAADKNPPSTAGSYNGVYFEVVESNAVNVVATDRKKLAVCRMSVKEGSLADAAAQNFFLPLKSASLVKTLCKSGECEISRFNHMVTFKFADMEFATTLLSTGFPKYSPILESAAGAENRLDINANDLYGIVRRATILDDGAPGNGTYGGYKAAQMDFYPNRLVVSSANKTSGESEEEMLCGYNGAPLTVMVDAERFCEMLNALVAPDVVVMIKSPTAPLRIASGNVVVIFMPLRS